MKNEKLKILKEPHNLLHQKCQLVTDFEEAKKISEELFTVIKAATKWWNRFLGFAANQIGYNKRIIILRAGNNYNVLINPYFIEKKFPFPYLENCFSLRGYYFVKRYLYAKVKYQGLDKVWHEMTLRGFSGIYQEIDHIDGILISEVGFSLFDSNPPSVHF